VGCVAQSETGAQFVFHGVVSEGLFEHARGPVGGDLFGSGSGYWLRWFGSARSRVSFFMNRFRKLEFIEYNCEIRVHNTLLNIFLQE
jgi:hypothetical protein